MQPIRDKILIRPLPSDEITTGGIIVPDTAKEVNNKGVVIAVGNGTKDKAMQFKPGDVVYRVKDNGTEIYIDGQLHILISQDWILAHN